jgi:hypothetical protein
MVAISKRKATVILYLTFLDHEVTPVGFTDNDNVARIEGKNILFIQIKHNLQPLTLIFSIPLVYRE